MDIAYLALVIFLAIPVISLFAFLLLLRYQCADDATSRRMQAVDEELERDGL